MEGRVVNGGRQSGTARLIVMEKTLSSLGNGGGAREVARFFVLVLSKSKFEANKLRLEMEMHKISICMSL